MDSTHCFCRAFPRRSIAFSRRLSLAAALMLHCIPVNAAQTIIGAHTFTIPDGFEIELIAGPPLVDRPMMADFDEQGRLYVADSAGANYSVHKQLEDKPHRIVRLEDSDGDGRFDTSTTFADKMMFPEGVLWHNGAVYSGAPPIIWKLEDQNDDGIADRRTEWFDGQTLTGCANDLHGPYLGPDGWIYWCKGAFAKQTHDRPGRPPISDSAAHIFRSRPDGSDFDSLMSGGMDNPVEVAFTGAGEAIFTTTFYSHPRSGQRDALVHAIYGGVYPKVHGVLDGLTRTGDLMPAMTHLGPAVPSGLVRYRGSALGADFTDNLFSTQFNLHKVQRHLLVPAGATFKTRDFDFVTSNNTDFHPTDVLEDADGSLIVIDTGGWYKICCPTSQLAKPDVLGAIYRIRRIGAPKLNDPRGLNLNWASMTPQDLARHLDDARPAVRSRAIEQLAKRGQEAVSELEQLLTTNPSIQARRNAVWALTRVNDHAARHAVRTALADSNPTVRQAAAHSAGMHRDPAAVSQLIALLESENLHLKRTAAIALGRIGDKTAVPALLSEAVVPRERVLEHSLIYALIEIGDRETTAAGLNATSSHARRAALIALDQMRNGHLTAQQVAPLLGSEDPVLKETAVWISGFHPEWGEHLAGFFNERLLATEPSESAKTEVARQLAQFASNEAIQDLFAAVLSHRNHPPDSRELVLRAIAGASLKQTPGGWAEPLRMAIRDSNAAVARAAVAAVRTLPTAKTNAIDFSDALLHVANDTSHAPDIRLNALSALPAGNALEKPAFDFLLGRLADGVPPVERSTAAGVLGRVRLTDDQLLALTDAVRSSGPLEISLLLGAFERQKNETIGTQLLHALEHSKGSSGLRADLLRSVLRNSPNSIQKRGEALLNRLNRDLNQQKARLETLEATLKDGDVRRGQAIFNGTRAACGTCHQVGYLGGKVGPDLTRIGAVRTERDLIESIVFPSASFVRSYEPIIVTTKDGEEYSGILRQENADTLLLISGAGIEQRLAMSDVAEMHPGTVSTMPEGLDQQLSEQELADLIAFLKSLR